MALYKLALYLLTYPLPACHDTTAYKGISLPLAAVSNSRVIYSPPSETELNDPCMPSVANDEARRLEGLAIYYVVIVRYF